MMNDDRHDRTPKPTRPSHESPKRGDSSSDSGRRTAPASQPAARPLRKRKKVALPIVGRRPEAPAWIGHLDHPFKLDRARVSELVGRLNIDAPVDTLYQHLELVKSINEDVNLVSRANVDAVLMQSLWESLIPMTNMDWNQGAKILDLGTGGGFPGFPMALCMPDSKMTLLDSRRAKTLSLERMVSEMQVSNVNIVHDRAETHAERLSEPYDSIVVRAVSVLPEVAAWSESLLKPGGTLLSWKGPEGEREAKALDSSKWKLSFALSVLPHRYVIVLERLGNLVPGETDDSKPED